MAGRWLVAALQEVGYREMSIRQVLFRMVRNGELTARIQGRKKFYRPTPAVTPEVHAVSDRIYRVEGNTWDGQWSIIQAAGGGDKMVRERLQDVLYLHGFAWIAPGVYIHPRDRLAAIKAAARNLEIADGIEMFRARRVAADHREYAARHWDLVGLRKGYDEFLRQYEPLQRTVATLPDDVAFVLRFAVAADFLKIAVRDPELPLTLLPPKWPGVRAQALVIALDRALLPAATAHADALAAAMRPR